MSTPDFAKGASGPAEAYDVSPAGLGLNPTYLAPGASASASSVSGSTPPGTILAYGGSSAPAGYVLCDGTSYDGTTSTYMNLWDVIGTTYGGTGQSSFKVPDIQGRVLVGKGTNASVSSLGTNDGQSVANRRPHHRTSLTDPGHHHRQQVQSGGSAGGDSVTSNIDRHNSPADGNMDTQNSTTGITVGTGNANDALDTPSFIVINYIISL